eukprot:CAMPEP_0114692544 /NCGR_PEP_ID=MMETSP0191-20121206/68065_1 /TAXON_ID=126664 /ORGANISM="Sorites sp." /LENGTH=248 /DNA_ID=CAMNT_0001985095 /DNA_START=43 /DNA_END=790 /DNA_ORIENTATION=+
MHELQQQTTDTLNQVTTEQPTTDTLNQVTTDLRMNELRMKRQLKQLASTSQASSAKNFEFNDLNPCVPTHPCVDDELMEAEPEVPRTVKVRLLHHEDMDQTDEDDLEDDDEMPMEAEISDPKSTLSHMKRQYRRAVQEAALKEWLKKHKFSDDIHEPRMGAAAAASFAGSPKQEELYPIHVAAQLGDVKCLRLLLRLGADAEQRTSRNRRALDLARKADIAGSHADVIHLLRSEVRFVRARDMLTMAA